MYLVCIPNDLLSATGQFLFREKYDVRFSINPSKLDLSAILICAIYHDRSIQKLQPGGNVEMIIS